MLLFSRLHTCKLAAHIAAAGQQAAMLSQHTSLLTLQELYIWEPKLSVT